MLYFIIIALNNTIYVLVYYVKLLKGKFFILITIYSIVLNGILNLSFAKVIIIYNLTNVSLKIPKGIYIRIIHKCKNIANFISFFKGALTAFIVVTAILLIFFNVS